jgi:hypothetical protein
VKERGAAAGEADDWLEAHVPRRFDGSPKPGRSPVLLREGELAGGAVEAEGRAQFTRCNPDQERLGDGGAVCGTRRKPLANEPEQGFWRIMSVSLQM